MKQKLKKNKASSIVHDANNALASLFMCLELLQREIPGTLTTQQKRYVKDSLVEVKKIRSLIKKLST